MSAVDSTMCAKSATHPLYFFAFSCRLATAQLCAVDSRQLRQKKQNQLENKSKKDGYIPHGPSSRRILGLFTAAGMGRLLVFIYRSAQQATGGEVPWYLPKVLLQIDCLLGSRTVRSPVDGHWQTRHICTNTAFSYIYVCVNITLRVPGPVACLFWACTWLPYLVPDVCGAATSCRLLAVPNVLFLLPRLKQTNSIASSIRHPISNLRVIPSRCMHQLHHPLPHLRQSLPQSMLLPAAPASPISSHSLSPPPPPPPDASWFPLRAKCCHWSRRYCP